MNRTPYVLIKLKDIITIQKQVNSLKIVLSSMEESYTKNELSRKLEELEDMLFTEREEKDNE